ncbi:UvrD-helicase domain-containing protein [Aureispira anguillae]|uniref:DNA 3'-5' helicase n=1 Tax=Aureispira anguillae TaxID=2864201 RepID=A0A915YKK7_9BACT|nr:UvrD-helicase domain-containing protein [Aureispira anguillae]BDS14734.1 UvrD-helicase domain-containing protein [Aureispira anguillae]
MNLKIISAGAGSGKTYSLTKEMATLLAPTANGPAEVRASGIIATTFTNKAAAELKERVRIELLEGGLTQEADELGNAMIGTVHSIGVQLLKRFSFEAGVSPEVDIIADSDQQTIFNQSLATVIPLDLVLEMEQLSEQLGFNKSAFSSKDWRADLKQLTDIARSNNFGIEVLTQSKAYSLSSFFDLLPQVSKKSGEALNAELAGHLKATLAALEANEDGTKSKETLMGSLRAMKTALKNRGFINWYDWAKLTKLKAPKKSRDDVFDLMEFAKCHNQHPDFHEQIQRYINHIFDTAIAALKEYEQYKKARGLIDYIDMEVLILKLLENEMVQEVLEDEIDLLLVDEFQDTNPIQLKIFLKLTQIANKSIWVGDPKQSIYGFRGAAPDLMKAVMDSTDNIANLPNSWRSREDLVHLCNGLFVKAFGEDMPVERIALNTAAPFAKNKESDQLNIATHHWHFQFEGNRAPAKPWFEQCIARNIAEILEEGWMVRIKGSNEVRPMQAGDIAVLCRSNFSCQTVADALHKEGLKASISRNGLLQTAEASLILACLRYILNKHDALAVAEILLLAQKHHIEDIIANRLEYLEQLKEEAETLKRWGHDNAYIQQLRTIRHKSKELSATEILNSVIEKLDIRRTVATWSNEQQRLDNIDALRKLTLDYEETCNRLNSAATLGGFLLWLDELAREGLDQQGKGAGMDAVNVLTYHKSKGLEWPFVVCHSLPNELRESIWGIRIVRQTPEIDIQQPLANRLLCYWINPYADQIKGTQLMELVETHEAKLSSKKEALAEEARLLYVGLTRARDYLVFPTMPKKPTKWLNRVFHNGDETIPSLDVNASSLLWLWKEEEIPVRVQTFNYEKNMPTTEMEVLPINYLSPHLGEQEYQSIIIESAQSLFPNLEYKFKGSNAFAKAYLFLDNEKVNFQILQPIFSTFIQADNPTSFDLKTREKIACNLLEQHDLIDAIKPKTLMYYSAAFYKSLEQAFDIQLIEKYRAFRFVSSDGKRHFSGVVDLVILTKNKELILMQQLTQDIPKLNSNLSKLKEEMGILEAAGRALKSIYYASEVKLCIVQSLAGIWAAAELKKEPKQSTLFSE